MAFGLKFQHYIVRFALLMSFTCYRVQVQTDALVPVPGKPNQESHGIYPIDPTLSHYVVLGVSKTATDKEIKQAYRRQARRFHPDVNPGDKIAEANFRAVSDAFEVLIDPEKRARYDTFGNTTAHRSIYTEAFIRMTELDRFAFLNRMMEFDEPTRVLDALVEDLGRRASKSADAFRALASIYRFKYEFTTNEFLNFRMSAFEEMNKSDPHRAEVSEIYFEIVDDIFRIRRSKRLETRRLITSEGGYFVGLAISAFFNDKSLSAEQFQQRLTTMGRMLPFSSGTTWIGLTKNLPEIYGRFPNPFISYMLRVYRKAMHDLVRPEKKDPQQPPWLIESKPNTFADASAVAEGLLEIARLRPDWQNQIYKVLTQYPQLMATKFGQSLVRAAEQNDFALAVFKELLAQVYPADLQKKLKTLLEVETANLDRNRSARSIEQVAKIEIILDLMRTSVALNPDSKASVKSETSCSKSLLN